MSPAPVAPARARPVLCLSGGIIAACALLLAAAAIVAAQGDDLLSDPVVYGAWLYEGNCVRCHGSYENERLASGMTEADLPDAMRGGRGGCQVTWDRRRGGPLGARELNALAAYMVAWEEAGGPPDLPPLPPQPTPAPARPRPGELTSAPSPTPEKTMSEEVRVAVEGSEPALGAYLYTEQCYRCHQAYARAQMGKGVSAAVVEKTIANGKTATSMKPFSRRKGGELTLREIRAIVSYISAWELLGEEPALPAVLFTPPTPNPARLLPVFPPEVPLVAGNPAVGRTLYAIHCASCHGPEGEGNIGPVLARPWFSARPDLTIRSAIRRGVPGSLMPLWSRATGGPLDNQQIDDLVALILDWAD